MTTQQTAGDVRPLTPAVTPAPALQAGMPIAIDQVPAPPRTGVELAELRERRSQLSD